MRIIGIDPGAHVGWCVADVCCSHLDWIDAGVHELSEMSEIAVAREIWIAVGVHRVALVAIEDFARRWCAPIQAQQMVQSAQSAGIIRGWLARGLDIEVRAYPAHEVRKALCGTPHAKDAQVKHALVELLGVKVPKRSNAHERDAALLAIYAGRI